MFSMLRDNLTALCSKHPHAMHERVNVSHLVESALKRVKPFSQASKVHITSQVASELHAETDAERCAPVESHLDESGL